MPGSEEDLDQGWRRKEEQKKGVKDASNKLMNQRGPWDTWMSTKTGKVFDSLETQAGSKLLRVRMDAPTGEQAS